MQEALGHTNTIFDKQPAGQTWIDFLSLYQLHENESQAEDHQRLSLTCTSQVQGEITEL